MVEDITDWALSWAAAQTREEARQVTQVGSNAVNTVLRLEGADRSLYLKIGPNLAREQARLGWLAGRLPVPQVLGLVSYHDVDALLMTALPGESLASLKSILPPQEIITRLSEALKTVHAIPLADWPFGSTGTVLVHGDACLPNFLYAGNRFTGCVDVGDMTMGDRETDLSAAVWSLQYNLGPGYGLAFLREHGLHHANEEDAERLRRRYESG